MISIPSLYNSAFTDTSYNNIHNWIIDNDFCRSHSKYNLDCYYESWSNCTIRDALTSNNNSNSDVSISHTFHVLSDVPSVVLSQVHQQLSNYKLNTTKVIGLQVTPTNNKFIPTQFVELLECSRFPVEKYRYWWRVVSTAYLLRPNSAVYNLIQQYPVATNYENIRSSDTKKSKSKKKKKGKSIKKKSKKATSLISDNSLHSPCVSIYMRRGDKHIEMEIERNTTVFLDTALRLWRNYYQQFQSSIENNSCITSIETLSDENGVSIENSNIVCNISCTNSNVCSPITESFSYFNISSDWIPTFFVGSEDPQAIEDAISWGNKHNYLIKYSNIFDRSTVSAHEDFHHQSTLLARKQLKHHPLEYFSLVYDIHHHLQCEAFVCTHKSNFCRVIDELRASIGAKANRQYADLSCKDTNGFCIDSPLTMPDW